LLQWTYLPESVRTTATVPDAVRAAFARSLASTNEVTTIALPLARSEGLQRIHAIDSQYDGIRTLSAPRAALEDLYALPARTEWGALEETRREKTLLEEAV